MTRPGSPSREVGGRQYLFILPPISDQLSALPCCPRGHAYRGNCVKEHATSQRTCVSSMSPVSSRQDRNKKHRQRRRRITTRPLHEPKNKRADLEKKIALHDRRIAITIALIIHLGVLFIPVHLSDTITIQAEQIVQLKLTPSISSIPQQKESPKPTQFLPAETATPVTPTNTAVLTQPEPEPADVTEKSVTPSDQGLAKSEAHIDQPLSTPSSPPLAITEKPVIAPRLDAIAGLEPFKSVAKRSLAESDVLTPLPSHDAVTQEIPNTINNAKVPELAVESPLLNPGRAVTKTPPEPAQIIQEETAIPVKPTNTAALTQAEPVDTAATEKSFTPNDQGLAKSEVQIEQPLPDHPASPMAIVKKPDIPTKLTSTAELTTFQTLAKPSLAKNKAAMPLQSADTMQQQVLQTVDTAHIPQPATESLQQNYSKTVAGTPYDNEKGIAVSANVSNPEHRTFSSAQVSLIPNFSSPLPTLGTHKAQMLNENSQIISDKIPLSPLRQNTAVSSLSRPPKNASPLPSLPPFSLQEPIDVTATVAEAPYSSLKGISTPAEMPNTEHKTSSFALISQIPDFDNSFASLITHGTTTIAANTDTATISEPNTEREGSAADGTATGTTLASNESASTGGNTGLRQSNILPFRKKPLFINGTWNGEEEGTEEGTGTDENKSTMGSTASSTIVGPNFTSSSYTGSASGGFSEGFTSDGTSSIGSLATDAGPASSPPTSPGSIKSPDLPESTALAALSPVPAVLGTSTSILEPVIESTESTLNASPTDKAESIPESHQGPAITDIPETKTQETDSLHTSATAQGNNLPAVPASSDAVASVIVSVTSVDEVLTRMSALIAERKTYPDAAKLRNAEGTVKVGVSINKDGSLKSSKIVIRSGSVVLDRSAADLVKGLFPISFNLATEMEVVVTIEYRLTH